MLLYEIFAGTSQSFMELAASTWGGDASARLFRASPVTNVELKVISPDEVYVAEIYTRPDKRGAGEGSAVMSTLCQMADKTGTTLSLLPSSDDTEALRRWYAKYGFVGDRKMIRQPR